MIKEYNYYITTGRFSQIEEDLKKAVRDYADSFGSGTVGNPELREKARLLCEDHLVKSGLRTEDNSFINIDSEFFESGELMEDSLNRFIKDVLKAHTYQKILWEYMGTTGLMTDVSKRCMKQDGVLYEKYLPASLKQKEIARQNERIKFQYNKLADKSGFDWSKGYDPNYTVEKIGWKGAYDNDGVWNYYKTDENGEIIAGANGGRSKQSLIIQLIKTERGAMLYDAGEILLNPVILWYLTHDNEVYGGEESDTAKIIENLREQMKVLGVEKITEVVCRPDATKEEQAEYKNILADLASPDLIFTDKATAEKLIEQAEEKEKTEIIQGKNLSLQKKIDAIVSAKPEITGVELSSALTDGTVSIPLNTVEFEDAQKASFAEDEYRQMLELYKELPDERKKSFIKASTILSSYWDDYSSCGKTKKECISLLAEYLQSGTKTEFSYEKSLGEVIRAGVGNNVPSFGMNVSDIGMNVPDISKSMPAIGNNMPAIGKNVPDAERLLELIKSVLPQENQAAAEEYIRNLPEQNVAVRKNVYASLENAVSNYLPIRSCTGMRINELFDFAVKTSGGSLPKKAFVPVTGYITPASKAKSDESERRILFEKDTEALFAELLGQPLPEKEVRIVELEKQYEERNKEKPVIMIGSKLSSSYFEMLYDSGDADGVSPAVAALLKQMMVKKGSVADAFAVTGSPAGAGEGRVYAAPAVSEVPQLSASPAASRSEILNYAKTARSADEFISYLRNKFSLDYDFTDAEVRELFAGQNGAVDKELLDDYSQTFETETSREISRKGHASRYMADVAGAFRQVDFAGNTGSAGVKIPAGGRIPAGASAAEFSRIAGSTGPATAGIPSEAGIPAGTRMPALPYGLKLARHKTKSWAGETSFNTVQHRLYEDESPKSFQNVQIPSINMYSANKHSTGDIQAPRTVRISSTNEREHINLETPAQLSSDYKDAVHNVMQKRHEKSGRKTPFGVHPPLPENLSPEELRMYRMNANYEHDKAVLAKTDPGFAAKNQFWDVGHAEANGELAGREKEKLSNHFAHGKFSDLE